MLATFSLNMALQEAMNCPICSSRFPSCSSTAYWKNLVNILFLENTKFKKCLVPRVVTRIAPKTVGAPSVNYWMLQGWSPLQAVSLWNSACA